MHDFLDDMMAKRNIDPKVVETKARLRRIARAVHPEHGSDVYPSLAEDGDTAGFECRECGKIWTMTGIEMAAVVLPAR